MPKTVLTFALCSLFLSLIGCNSEQNKQRIDRVENYKPTKPITFPHVPHSDIDCKYCHNSVNKTQLSPTICLNCHQIKNDSFGTSNEENMDRIIRIIRNQSETSIES